jgi:hypothetical protein
MNHGGIVGRFVESNCVQPLLEDGLDALAVECGSLQCACAGRVCPC